MMMSIHQDPLDQVVAILVASNVNERNPRTVWSGGSDNTKIAIQEIHSTDLEAFFHDFGCKLVNAVVVRVGENVIDDTTLIGRGSMLAKVLNAPVAELTVSDEVDVG